MTDDERDSQGLVTDPAVLARILAKLVEGDPRPPTAPDDEDAP